ncbi:MAG: RNA 2',3'-cyclic phosphodiesterase, partial [Candidatus Methylomirabilaceae bacterium]
VAANLDPGLRERAARVQERLWETRADVAWVRPENLHLTLKFLGEVEETALGAVADAIGSVATGPGPFRLVFAGLGAFPQPRTARVVWVGVGEGAEGLAELHARLEAALEPLGFRREERPFTSHLTVGRVRGPGRREQLAAAVTSMAAEPLGEMLLDRIDLMRSELRPEGARYSVLHTFPLVGPV